MRYPIITIGREHGSGGRLIAKRLAADLNIPLYDKKLIDMIAKDSGFAEETHDEYAILDRAGRLQIPREMLEAAGVTGNQVRLEMQDGRIVLTAPKEQRDA